MADIAEDQQHKATPWLAYILFGAILFVALVTAYVYFSGGGLEPASTPPVNVTAPGATR